MDAIVSPEQFCAAVEAVEARIRPYVRLTPLVASPALSSLTGARVLMKLENRQHTGSFKARGAFAKLLSLDGAAMRRGVVAASTGNHGAGVAYAAAALGIRATVVVPEGTAPMKLANMRANGAEIVVHGAESAEAETFARAEAARRGVAYLSPYNDLAVVEGQATIGVEMLRDAPNIQVAIASLGGGGLVGGIGTYLKAVNPHVQIAAASAANSAAMMASLHAGRIVDIEHLPTISDGTAGGVEQGAVTFDLCRGAVDELVAVSEEEIRDAMRIFVHERGEPLEGAAGVAIAGLLRAGRRYAGRTVAVVICGGNVADDVIASLG